MGHEVTHDWTDSNRSSTWEPKSEPQFARGCAESDMTGVIDCELMVLVDKDSITGGCYAELGGSIVMSILARQGMLSEDCNIRFPKEIVVVSGRGKRHIFYYHPTVLHLDSYDDVVSYIDYVEFKQKQGGRLK